MTAIDAASGGVRAGVVGSGSAHASGSDIGPDGAHGSATAGASGGSPAGSVRIAERALVACTRAVTAEQFRVPPSGVHVTLSDEAGVLALDISTTIRRGTGIVDAVHAGAEQIRSRVSALTGRRIGRARIELTGLEREPRARVR